MKSRATESTDGHGKTIESYGVFRDFRVLPWLYFHTNRDRFDLSRFVAAQDSIYPEALSEIRAGRKRSHWMWFVFPQAIGLGTSPMARHYAIRSLAEARAYLAHPVLGHHLRECAESLLRLRGESASEIFGHPDDLKLGSSMTLFASVAEKDSVFEKVLEQYFAGKPDPLTLGFIERDAAPE